MSAKKLSAKKRQPDRPRRPRPSTGETRAVDGLTVAWMMSVVTTVLCGTVGIPVALLARDRPGAEGARIFGGLLHFAGFIAAVLSLVLLACVLKFRKSPPPPAITWASVVAALAVIGATLMY